VVGAITLFGCLMGSLILLPQADHFGRRTMSVALLAGQTFAMVLFLQAMITLQSFWMLCLACFIAGSVSVPLVGVMICYVTELSSREMMHVVTGASFMSEALTSILVGLYFKYYKSCAVFYLLITVQLFGFLIFYVLVARESPHYLYKSGRYTELLEHLRLMAHWNGYTGQLPSV
jgi:MFS family permease